MVVGSKTSVELHNRIYQKTLGQDRSNQQFAFTHSSILFTFCKWNFHILPKIIFCLSGYLGLGEKYIKNASGSMNIANSRGQRGHRCLVPLCRAKLCDVILFVVTVAFSELYCADTQWINDSSKPNLWGVAKKKDQLTLSFWSLRIKDGVIDSSLEASA